MSYIQKYNFFYSVWCMSFSLHCIYQPDWDSYCYLFCAVSHRQQWHFLTILCFSDVSPEIKAPELKRFSSRVSEEITNISNSAQIACNHLSFQLFFLIPYDLINAICISFSCLYLLYLICVHFYLTWGIPRDIFETKGIIEHGAPLSHLNMK